MNDSPETAGPKEIIGSDAGGRVLHKDIVHQNARPGDYIMVFRGERLSSPRILTQADIDYSRNEYAKLNKELRDTSPGSVRALLSELVADTNLDIPKETTNPEEVDFDLLTRQYLFRHYC
jgi:hypothetical protein